MGMISPHTWESKSMETQSFSILPIERFCFPVASPTRAREAALLAKLLLYIPPTQTHTQFPRETDRCFFTKDYSCFNPIRVCFVKLCVIFRTGHVGLFYCRPLEDGRTSKRLK